MKKAEGFLATAVIVVAIASGVAKLAADSPDVTDATDAQAVTRCPASLPSVKPSAGDSAGFGESAAGNGWVWHVRFADGSNYELPLGVDLATRTDTEVKDWIIGARERTWMYHAASCQSLRGWVNGRQIPVPSSEDEKRIYEKVYQNFDASRIDAAALKVQCADVPVDLIVPLDYSAPLGFSIPIDREH